MATLPPLLPNGDGTINTAVITRSSGAGTYFSHIDEDPGTGQPDAQWLFNAGAAGGDSHFAFENTPADFGTMTALTVDTYTAVVGRVDDDIALRVSVLASNETTLYAGDAGGTQGAMVGGAVNPAGLKTTTLTLTTAGTNATKADWDAAVIRLNWVYTQSMSKDAYDLRVHAVELNGTYSAGQNLTATINDGLGLTDTNRRNLAMLVEDFSDATFADTEFEIRTPQTGATTSLNVGRLRLENDVTSGLTDELVSKKQFDARSSQVIFEAPTSPYDTGGTYSDLLVQVWGDGIIPEAMVDWYSEVSPVLREFSTKIGAQPWINHSLSAADTRWVRISYSTTTWSIDTSPDRLTWTNRDSFAGSSDIAKAVEIRTIASSDGAGVWHLDNFNVVVATPLINDSLGLTDSTSQEVVASESFERTIFRRTSGTLVMT